MKGVEGTTTIPRPPQRVVSVGQYRDSDAAVALGVVPLITPDLGKFLPGGMSPWLKAKAGTHPPELFADTQLPFERIAALKPDLILGTDRSTLAQDYKTLSAIAPTLSSASGYNKDTWQVTTRRVATALGRSPEALFFAQLGLVLSPKVTSLPQTSIPGRSQISPERLDLIDADVLVLTYTTPGSRAQTEALPLFQQLPAVRRGSYVALDITTAIALAFPSALSVPYGLQQVVPKISGAIKA
ncbi:ABC transporter substrate-binding protein [Amycolatopsis sp. NPDC001319]|uniref:ABC transporter substrate-binding protein n=1 Tax=unclassified Amycolatopsis TaxID=2618356 RepID=UPI0036861880